MVYGHYFTDTVGSERFFVEGCMYCRMSTGGQHESTCPVKDIKVSDKPKRLNSPRQVRDSSIRILKYDDAGNFIKEFND